MIKIVAGLGENKDIIEACEIFKKKNKDAEIKLVKNDRNLVGAILDNNVDAVIRGSLPALIEPIPRTRIKFIAPG